MIKHNASIVTLALFATVACSDDLETEPTTPSKSTATDSGSSGEAVALTGAEEHDYRDVQPETANLLNTTRGFEWTHELTHVGATFIALHFQGFNLPEGAVLRVTDGRGGQGYELTGRGKMDAGTFWAQHIKGDTIRLELTTTDFRMPFVIDKYSAGLPPQGSRAICGVDDKRDAACYRDTHPEQYENSRAVARLLSNGRGFCTGWLVGPDNLLLTNNHCIGNAQSALDSDYEFMAEASSCDGSSAGQSTIFSGGELLATDVALDYSLIRVNGNPAGQFGYLRIDDRVARVGEPIYIAGHPGGRLKELTIESTAPQDRGGIPRVFSIDEPACTGGGTATFNDVGYYGDTEGGNSGSPVISSETHGVIALHHCANCPNRGVPIHLVVDEIEEFLINSEGKVDLDRETLACGGTFEIVLRDRDLADITDQTITVNTDDGDVEIVALEPLGGGAFSGTVTLGGGTPTRGDSIVQADDGNLVIATYDDADDGTGAEARVQDALFVDCVAPFVTEVSADARAFSARVLATTNEDASVLVRYGTSCDGLSAIGTGPVAQEHSVILNDLDPSTSYFYALEVQDPAGNLITDDNAGSCFQFDTIAAPDTYFVENFSNNSPFDLSGNTLRLTPDGTVNFYSACIQPTGFLPVDPSAGTVLDLSDDASVEVPLNEPVSVFGVELDSVFIGSNGYITAEQETRFATFPGQFYERLGVAGLKRDLNPRLGGTVTYQELDDRFVASWVAVRSFNSPDENTFQVQMFHDGTITVSWLDVDTRSALVGVSDGAGTPVNFARADVSALGCQ